MDSRSRKRKKNHAEKAVSNTSQSFNLDVIDEPDIIPVHERSISPGTFGRLASFTPPVKDKSNVKKKREYEEHYLYPGSSDEEQESFTSTLLNSSQLVDSIFIPDTWKSKNIPLSELAYPLENHIMHEFLMIKKIRKLYHWQQECLKLKGPINLKNLVYSLPTSAGKSLVAEVHLFRHLLNGNTAMMVLPFVSIVQEKVSTMNILSHATDVRFVVEEYAAGKGVIPPTKRRAKPCLFICTIEKAGQLVASAINEKGPWLDCVVIDELHMIGEGVRGARLESLISKLLFASKQKEKSCQIIGMSATLPNLEDIADFMGAELFRSNFRPVPLTQYLKTEKYVHKITKDAKTGKISTTYNRTVQCNDLLDKDGIYQLLKEVFPEHSTLIFCPTRRNCEAVANLLTAKLTDYKFEFNLMERRIQMVTTLNKEMAEVGGLSKDFAKALLSGVCYHHAGLTAVERQQVEDGFRHGLISVLCCTSTLAAGVNLPARRVIIRDIIQGKKDLETATYRQMVGRAGRAGLDTMGESIIITAPGNRKKALDLIAGEMKPAKSQLMPMMEEVILSVLSLGLAVTRNDLLRFLTKYTLFGLQNSNVNFDECLDDIVSKLESYAVVEKKDAECNGILIPDEIDFRVTRIGTASVESNIEPQLCARIWEKLNIARGELNLLNTLHLISIAISDEVVEGNRRVSFDQFLAHFNKLSSDEVKAMKIIGITEADLVRHQCGLGKTEVKHVIGFLTLIMYRVSKGKHLALVADNFEIDRGTLQRNYTAIISEAARLSVFCNLIDELWYFSALFDKLVTSLSYSQYPELAELLQIPQMNPVIARQLYNHDITSPAMLVDLPEAEIMRKLTKPRKKQITIIKTNAKNLLQIQLDKIREKELDLLCPQRKKKKAK